MNQWSNPLKLNRLQPGGYGPGCGAYRANWQGDSEAHYRPGPGGHGESLRRTHGDAAGGELGAHPVDRCMVNVGTVPGLRSRPLSQSGQGQACRRLLARGRDGASVLVRARESRAPGEGRQQARNSGIAMPGGRR